MYLVLLYLITREPRANKAEAHIPGHHRPLRVPGEHGRVGARVAFMRRHPRKSGRPRRLVFTTTSRVAGTAVGLVAAVVLLLCAHDTVNPPALFVTTAGFVSDPAQLMPQPTTGRAGATAPVKFPRWKRRRRRPLTHVLDVVVLVLDAGFHSGLSGGGGGIGTGGDGRDRNSSTEFVVWKLVHVGVENVLDRLLPY